MTCGAAGPRSPRGSALRKSPTSRALGTRRSVRSSDTRAGAGVYFVSSGVLALRHTREGDQQDIGGRAQVEHVIDFAWSLDECLSRAVGRGLALVANR